MLVARRVGGPSHQNADVRPASLGHLKHENVVRVPREQKLLKGHLSRVIYHREYQYTKKNGQAPNWLQVARKHQMAPSNIEWLQGHGVSIRTGLGSIHPNRGSDLVWNKVILSVQTLHQ